MTSSLQKNTHGISAWSITLCFILTATAAMLPDFASAAAAAANIQTDNAITRTICNVVMLMQGNIARGVAAFGVIFLGFSLFLGKISWGTAMALGIGLGGILGAQQLVNLIGGGTAMSCAVSTALT